MADNENKIRIYLEDEIPALGCGWRTFNVEETDDYTYLSDTFGRRVRINSVRLNEIIKSSEERLRKSAA